MRYLLIALLYYSSAWGDVVAVVEVTANVLNVRKAPGTASPIAGKLHRGEQLIARDSKRAQWLNVYQPGGLQGYVSAEYVKFVKLYTVEQKREGE